MVSGDSLNDFTQFIIDLEMVTAELKARVESKS